MPKRTFWLVTGAAIGAGSSLWAERRVRRTVQQAAARLQPDALVVEVGRSARQVAGEAGDRLRDALSSGKEEMWRREEELWSDLAAQGMAADLAVPTASPYPLPPDRSAPDRSAPAGPGGPTDAPALSAPASPYAHQEPVRRRPLGRRGTGRRTGRAAKSPSDLAR